MVNIVRGGEVIWKLENKEDRKHNDEGNEIRNCMCKLSSLVDLKQHIFLVNKEMDNYPSTHLCVLPNHFLPNLTHTKHLSNFFLILIVSTFHTYSHTDVSFVTYGSQITIYIFLILYPFLLLLLN